MSESPNAALHQSFRNLLLLLRFLRNINAGSPNLNNTTAPKLSDLTSRPRVIDAVATILVMDHEILAVAALSSSEALVCQDQDSHESSKEADESSTQSHDSPGTDLSIPNIDDDSPSQHRKLGIAAIGNPNEQAHCNITLSPTNSSGLVLVPDGRDIWSDLSNNEWAILPNEVIPLADHAATVRQYLDKYRQTTHTEQIKMSAKFFRYLIISCGRKMYRRITHWASLGLIWTLFTIHHEELEQATDNWQWDNPEDHPFSDRTLSSHLQALDGKAFVKYLKEDGMTDQHWSQLVKPDPENHVFRKDTVLAFHHLFVATLMVYTRSLNKIAISSGWNIRPNRKNSKAFVADEVKMKNAVNSAVPFIRLLVSLAHSQSLSHYLRFLVANSLLKTPSFNDKIRYRFFAKRHTIIIKNDDEEDDEDDETGEEYAEAARVGITGNVGVFRRWIMTFVGHFSATQILEKHAGSCPKNKDINFRIIATQRLNSPMTTWQDIKEIVTTIMKEQHSDEEGGLLAAEKIAAIKDHIQSYVDRRKVTSLSYSHIFEVFSALSSETKSNPFPGNKHCEAILAALAKFIDVAVPRTPTNSSLIQTCNDLDIGHIAVSRLCCPVCWDLMDILRSDSNEGGLQVRGHHSTLYDVELPEWLPTRILEEMIMRYRSYVKEELKVLPPPGYISKGLSLSESMESDW